MPLLTSPSVSFCLLMCVSMHAAVGAENSFGRLVIEAHYKACLYAGINISGINGEVRSMSLFFIAWPLVCCTSPML